MPFGFTRKKHNCYNCGLLFCRACSSKKVMNASLAPNKSKPSRVCDSCSYSMQNITHPGGVSKLENLGSKKLLSQQKKALSDEKEERGRATPPGHRLQLMSQPSLEIRPGERNTPRNQGEKQQHLENCLFYFSWIATIGDKCPCPAIFESCYIKNSELPLESKSSISSSLNQEEELSDSKKMLIEEVKRLRAQARSLEMQCQTGSQKIEECQLTIEKTWSLAREEAAKRKAANEIIKALALRIKSQLGKKQKMVWIRTSLRLDPDYTDTPTLSWWICRVSINSFAS
ncbi:hypothetical protein NC651_037787 [Populus alba x Populus x berolinensis]|nr:hypothetical protein NC651_037787 [Populus alba x Populus x berolinensis]